MPFRSCLPGLALLLLACAPTVPRPPRAAQPPDTGDDAGKNAGQDSGKDSGGPAPSVALDARSEGRPPATLTVDARGDTSGGVDVGATETARGDGRADGGDSAHAGGADADADADHGDGNADLAVDRTGVEPSPGELVIDELLINPAGTDTNREWIEVVNVASFALDLHALHVADAASDVALDAGVLAPGGILVLGQSLDPTKNGGAPVSFSFGNSISLNNGGDAIALCLGPCATGLVLERIGWTADLGAAYDGHAAIVGPGDGLFCPAGEPFGTAGSFGSPGSPTPPCGDAGADAGRDGNGGENESDHGDGDADRQAD